MKKIGENSSIHSPGKIIERQRGNEYRRLYENEKNKVEKLEKKFEDLKCCGNCERDCKYSEYDNYCHEWLWDGDSRKDRCIIGRSDDWRL